MSFQPLVYAKAHPLATGTIVVIGGIIFIMIVRGGGSSSSEGGGSSARLSDAEIAANAQIQAAMIQAQGQAAAIGADLQKTNILAGVQMNSDKLASEVAFANIDAQKSLGLASIEAGRQTDLASINAQQAMFITNSNNQVETQRIIANAAKSKNKTSTIGSVLTAGIGAIAGIFSDQRLKENFIYLGRAPEGYGIYEFNYKGSTSRYIGVIADDVNNHVPGAVVESPSKGFLKVIPSRLNFNPMRKIPGAVAA